MVCVLQGNHHELKCSFSRNDELFSERPHVWGTHPSNLPRPGEHVGREHSNVSASIPRFVVSYMFVAIEFELLKF